MKKLLALTQAAKIGGHGRPARDSIAVSVCGMQTGMNICK